MRYLLILLGSLTLYAGPFFFGQQGALSVSSTATTVNPATYGTVAWWIAAHKEAYADSAAVGTVTDWSASGINATQATAAAKPTFRTGQVNGYAAFSADGVDDDCALASNPGTGLTASTLIMVFKATLDPPVSASAAAAPLCQFGSDALGDHIPYTDGNVYYGFASNARKLVGNPATTLAQWNVLSVVSKSGAWTMRLNGTQIFTTASNTVGWGATPELFHGSVQWAGMLAEAVIWNGDLGANLALAEAAYKTQYATP